MIEKLTARVITEVSNGVIQIAAGLDRLFPERKIAELEKALRDVRREAIKLLELARIEHARDTKYVGELEVLLDRALREVREKTTRDAIVTDQKSARRYWKGEA